MILIAYCYNFVLVEFSREICNKSHIRKILKMVVFTIDLYEDILLYIEPKHVLQESLNYQVTFYQCKRIFAVKNQSCYHRNSILSRSFNQSRHSNHFPVNQQIISIYGEFSRVYFTCLMKVL